MALDPTMRFEDYEASDDDKSDEEFFNKMFDGMGIQIPDMQQEKQHDLQRKKSAASSRAKALHIASVMQATTKAASKFLQRRKKKPEAPQDGYVEQLKKMLLEEAAAEAAAKLHSASVETSDIPSQTLTVQQSRREFMVNIKPSKVYNHPIGIFGGAPSRAFIKDAKNNEIEILMGPQAAVNETTSGVGVASSGDLTVESSEAPKVPPKPTKLRMVVKQRKKLKFQRKKDVIFEEEADLSETEIEATNQALEGSLQEMDDEFKERYETINGIFFGSSIQDLMDMYQFKPAVYRYSQFDLGSRHELWRHHLIISVTTNVLKL